jgi:multidrug efflux pump subunit AcrA (membrane-fusion protein)
MRFLPLFTFIFSFSLIAENLKVTDFPAHLNRTITSYCEPSAFLDLEAEFPARLKQIYLKEGQTISDSKKPLIQQDDTYAKIAVERAEAASKSEFQALLKMNSEKKIAERETQYRLLEMNRIGKLSKSGKATQSSFDMAQFEYDRAALKTKDTDIAILVQKQVIAERQLTIKKAKEDLSRHTIHAPKGWILNEKYVEVGSLITAGQKIVQLVNTQELSAYFRLNEEEVNALENNPLDLRIKKTQKSIGARVHRKDLNFDPITRKTLVELRIIKTAFNSGTEVQLHLKVPYSTPAVEIPNAYIINKLEQDYVRLLNGKEIALTALRKTKKSVIVKLSDLPDGAELLKLKNN